MFWDFLRHAARVRRERPLKLAAGVDPASIMAARAALSPSQRGGLVPLGTVLAANARIPFALTAREALGHGLILGPTGGGKTYLALNYALALARLGFSIVGASPHPDMTEGFLRIAASLRRPCVHLDFGGRARVLTPFSFLRVAGVRPDELAHLATSLFALAFGAGGNAGVIRSTLGPIFEVLASFPDELNLLDADRLVHDPAFAQRFLKRLPNALPATKSFFAALAGKARNQTLQGSRFALARIHALLAYRGVRLSLCGRGPVNLRTVLKRPVVIVLSVPAATLGDASGLLTGLVLELTRLVLMQRAVPCTEPPVAVFVDELGSLVTGTERLGAFLAQARKFGAFLVGITQNTSQLDPALLDAFLSNASTLLLGRLSPQDARRFADLPRPVESAPPRFDAELSLDGIDARWGEHANRAADAEDSLARAFAECPPRQFFVSTALEGRPFLTRIRTTDFQENLGPDEGELELMGARPAREVEAEVERQCAAWTPGTADGESANAPAARPHSRRSGGSPPSAPAVEPSGDVPTSGSPPPPPPPPPVSLSPRGPVSRF